MKRLLPSFLLGMALLPAFILHPNSTAMESAQDTIQTVVPELKYEIFSDSYEISLNLNGEKIAYVTYKPVKNAPHAWEIDFIFVEREYRRNRYCALLFIECFKDMIAKNARVVSWESCPIEGNILSDDLNAMYRKLIIEKIMPLKSGVLSTLKIGWNNTKMFYNFNMA